ncbi:MAG: bifunctional glutamate N-acetyltransferase/amino-acid acetyltransferase ArgJ [Spirochaetales bacterium]|nr:bifunctional glutamate N-acetyltransferase/amino-acid acetyltransferase ArgJ [Spirochaetales bacterium]
MHFIDGGVCAPKGFTANGIHCGLKASRKTNDTALVYSEVMCNAAGIFTSNRVKAECVKLTMKNIAGGKMQAAICNVCFANACTGEEGYKNALRMADFTAKGLGIAPENVIVCSTGIIGQHVPVEKIEENFDKLKAGLSVEGHKEARTAIMTTDTQYKECAVETEIGGKTVHIGAMCKGSGMIHINMGTMLSFVTTDCAISSAMLDKAVKETVKSTYNCVSVDGDTSTNDTLTVMANGLAGNAEIVSEGPDYDAFLKALNVLNTQMAMKIAADGEGASHLVECTVKGAKDVETARGLAKFVIKSNLVKAAMFGRDANCGRIMCAMGYSGYEFDPDKTCVYFSSKKGSKRYFDTPEGEKFQVYGCDKCGGKIEVVHNGVGLSFDEEKATSILAEEAVAIEVVLQDGNAEGTAWGCDLTYDYVKINGDYRS